MNNNYRQKTPLRYRVQTPARHSNNLLSPNDDDYERAQARAARAAATRRKSNVDLPFSTLDPQGLLAKDQILELFHNCIKLSSENKINQRNTWELRLIDHLSEIVYIDEDDTETNFQKASCTLEAGVKIYSYRVDSVHSEAYKVLGGLNRASAIDKQLDGHGEEGELRGMEEDETRKEHHKKTSASSVSLEPSFEALNVKKFDVAFTVDPLYHHTSAQFDEGGAKGLLLNTLSVYDDCRIVFDSWDVPEKSMKLLSAKNMDSLSTIDLSLMKDLIEQSMTALQDTTEISPTFDAILKLLDDPYRAAAQVASAKPNEDTTFDLSLDNVEVVDEARRQYFENNYTADESFDDGLANASPDLASQRSFGVERHAHEENLYEDEAGYKVNGDPLSAQTVDFLVLGMGMPSNKNAWAGPEHWKFHKSKDIKQSTDAPGDSSLRERKTRKMKREPFSVDYTNLQEIDSSAFAPPKNQRSLILPQKYYSLENILPEDCHYQPEELVKLFILPSIVCIRKRGRKEYDGFMERNHSYEASFTCNNGDFQDPSCANWDDVHGESDVEDLNDSNMVAQPRKVSKIDVDYDKTSKDVDVRILKETLWDCIQNSAKTMEEDYEARLESMTSFKRLLDKLPATCPAAAPGNISVHLCFICLLHLANEHNLKIE
ncbi:hypothetical protein KI387_029868, partial [Taxus chinensis]